MAQQSTNSQSTSERASNSNTRPLRELLASLQLAWRLMLDPEVSLLLKAIMPVLALIYLLSPIDLLPDVIPVLGQLDDLAIILLIVRLFIELAPADAVARHQARIRGESSSQTWADSSSGTGQPGGDDFVDVDYRVINDG